jgi:signal transduction histidine kinase
MATPIRSYLKSIKFEYKISFTYLIVGILWILFSDKILNSAISDTKLLASIQTYKGIFYIFITTFLLFFLVKSHIEKIKNQQILFKTVFDTIPESVVITNIDRELIMVNKVASHKFAESSNSHIGQKTIPFYESKEEYDRVGKLVFNKFSENQISSYTINYKDKNQEIFPGETFSAKLFDSKGKWIGNLAVIRDLTEKNKVANELKESQAKLNTALKNITDAVFISDAEGVFINYNDSFATFHKFKNIADCPKRLSDFAESIEIYLPDDSLAPAEKYPIRRALNGETGSNEEFKLKRKDTNEVWIGSYSFAPIKNNHGDIIGTVTIARDVTTQKNAQIELIKAKEKAEESDRMKTVFLQNISHEIRTPLNAIIGFSELLCEDDLAEEKQKEYKNIILSSSHHLLGIVSDILTASVLLTEKVNTTMSSVNVTTIIKELKSIFENKATSKGITLKIEIDEDQNVYVITDETKLRQILTNFLSNAIKFTNKGGVILDYIIKESAIQFRVKDSGIGINKALHEKIFERFDQGEDTTGIEYGGTGLGLSISKEFAELLGGTIEMESVEDYGSTFIFTIPYVQS